MQGRGAAPRSMELVRDGATLREEEERLVFAQSLPPACRWRREDRRSPLWSRPADGAVIPAGIVPLHRFLAASLGGRTPPPIALAAR